MTSGPRQDNTEGHPEPPEDADGLLDLNKAVGRQVKLLREHAGLTQKELGDRLGYGEDLVSSLERGRRTPQPEFLDAADDLLGAGGLLKATKEDVARAKARARVRHPAWFRDYARLEGEAVEVNDYSSHDIPGLFQTERRARALYGMRTPLLDEETIEQRVVSRLARQDILAKWPPPMVTAVIEESVLRRPIGGAEVHKEQMSHLLALGRLRSVELQVMPLERDEHAGMGGPFILLTPKGKPQVGYVEVQDIARLATDAEEVRILAARYGSIRAQALTPRESLALIERMQTEL
ncbi:MULTISPECIES: helix-turn-helix domain-containing protein [Streptomyces]|uniref:helix-turn-helix domain-containing protein n=1 Tax=Streptomyces TaxID=1883 RepID=UPI0012923231|nr:MULTISPECIES: helix-turn-helix transcriptional regulator [Streptomyces]MCX5037898.1 helix-turn-helix domain-containing protein [Streptomyces coelicoflavus]QFX83993.1 helix-turn-helix domain-containing protein [Streptomyces sp. SYP-A7193]